MTENPFLSNWHLPSNSRLSKLCVIIASPASLQHTDNREEHWKSFSGCTPAKYSQNELRSIELHHLKGGGEYRGLLNTKMLHFVKEVLEPWITGCCMTIEENNYHKLVLY